MNLYIFIQWPLLHCGLLYGHLYCMLNLFDIIISKHHTAQENSVLNGKIKHALFVQHSYT